MPITVNDFTHKSAIRKQQLINAIDIALENEIKNYTNSSFITIYLSDYNTSELDLIKDIYINERKFKNIENIPVHKDLETDCFVYSTTKNGIKFTIK